MPEKETLKNRSIQRAERKKPSTRSTGSLARQQPKPKCTSIRDFLYWILSYRDTMQRYLPMVQPDVVRFSELRM
jgi:hypothetical protein